MASSSSICVYFDYRFINLPSSDSKAERKLKIQDLTKRLSPDSESFRLIGEFITLIDDDIVLAEKRAIFRDKVIERYEKLEEKIDEIRRDLENSS